MRLVRPECRKKKKHMTDRTDVTILVVDDQASIRRFELLILQRAGYRVTEARSGFEALALLREDKVFDLLIADIGMPGLTGVEMAAAIRTAYPDQKILYVTGRTDRLLDARSRWKGEAAFLEKPFSPRGLREAVSLLLYGTLNKPCETGRSGRSFLRLTDPNQRTAAMPSLTGPTNQASSNTTGSAKARVKAKKKGRR
jgi:CheY-like chemotaxis protein